MYKSVISNIEDNVFNIYLKSNYSFVSVVINDLLH